MRPLSLFLAALLLSASGLRASAESEALAALDAAGAQASASSAIRSPSLNNFDRVRGELSALPPFFQRLAEKLGGLQVGPSARVRELSLSLGVKMEEAGKTTSVNINALIESCRGIAADLDAFNMLVPQLRSALTQRLDQGAAEAVREQVALVLPTPVPGLANAPVIQPTPPPPPSHQPLPPLASEPTPVPPPAPVQHGGLEGGLLPGGIVVPTPPPTPALQLTPGQPTPRPTPQSLLKAPIAVASLANGKEVYVANFNEGSVAVLEAGPKRFTAFIPVGAQPAALALDNSGHLLACANRGSDSLSLIDTRERRVLATVKVGSQPVDVAFSNDGKKAYVVNQAGNSVSVVDVDKKRVLRSLSVGRQPSRLTLPANGRHLYVSNTQDDTVSVIDTGIDEVVATVSE